MQMEDIIARMQEEKNGIPIRTVKSFLSKIPSVFSGDLKRMTKSCFILHLVCLAPQRRLKWICEGLSLSSLSEQQEDQSCLSNKGAGIKQLGCTCFIVVYFKK